MNLRLTLLLAIAIAPSEAAKLTPATSGAFDHYIQVTEDRMHQSLRPEGFLNVDSRPDFKERVRGGEIVIQGHTTMENDKPIRIPGGQIQDWLGMAFFPNTTLERVRSMLQDYANYKDYYRPDVIESKLKFREGDEFDIFLRLYKHQVLTVVLNTDYHVRFASLDPHRMYLISHSTRVAEVKNPKQSYEVEAPVGNDAGFLWRLNAYWRFEEADGGVYAECEAISLSRDTPFGLGWAINGFLERFPKESMLNTLMGTRKAVSRN
jgi:hypothetical protein